jgi:hypothetical protein
MELIRKYLRCHLLGLAVLTVFSSFAPSSVLAQASQSVPMRDIQASGRARSRSPRRPTHLQAGNLTVEDANGLTIGPLFGANAVLLSIGGEDVIASFQLSGFATVDPSTFVFEHSSTDCSGPRYIDGSAVPKQGIVSTSRILYYPSPPLKKISIGSIETFPPGQFSNRGECTTLPAGGDEIAGAVATSDLRRFVKPFRAH